MSLPHFFVEHLDGPGVVRLSTEDTRHALGSLRLRPGAEITVADGHGLVGRGRVEGEEDGRAILEVRDLTHAELRLPAVSVALASPKGERLNWAVQKLAELGVDETVLVESTRSVRAWDAGRAERAVSRLRAVAREAAMQSRRPMIMEVSGPVALGRTFPGGHTLMLWEHATTRLADALPDDPAAVRVIVGPEGSFTDAEIGAAREAGVLDVSLGPGILRTETAAVVGAALVLARYGRLG